VEKPTVEKPTVKRRMWRGRRWIGRWCKHFCRGEGPTAVTPYVERPTVDRPTAVTPTVGRPTVDKPYERRVIPMRSPPLLTAAQHSHSADGLNLCEFSRILFLARR
jgi:hypothetical protein